MKVLHVWNTAGVGSIIAKTMDKLYGSESWVVMRKKFDPFGVTTYGECWDYNGKIFVLKALLKTRKYDLIHVHSLDRIIPFLKFLYPKKIIVLHYHGSDIRGRWSERKRFWCKADAILVSTKELLEGSPKCVIYMPNPVDTDLFNPKHTASQPNTAFHMRYFADDLAEEYAEKYGLKLHIHDRNKNPIPHKKLAGVLCDFGYYIDVKRVSVDCKIGKCLSKIGLEALACGLKVIDRDGELIHGLPLEHKSENVVKRIYEVYKNMKEVKQK